MMCEKTLADKPEAAKELLGIMQRAPAAGAGAAARIRTERRDYVPLLGSIEVPVLIVVGEFDQFTPVSDAELMHSQIPGSKLVVIKEAGHVTNLEQPAEFDAELGEFLRSLTRPA
jgi:pimeloyl-ACP methyl ester carboxylesterase